MRVIWHSLRFKTGLVLVTSLCASLGLALAFIGLTLWERFEQLEQRELLVSFERIAEMIEQEIERPTIQISDWAEWDDAAEYMTRPNSRFEAANLVEDSLEGLQLTAIRFYRVDKTLQGETHRAEFHELLNSLETTLIQTPEIWPMPESSEPKLGLLTGGGKHFIFATKNIRPTNRQGPSLGYVLFLKLVDSSLPGRLSHLLKLKIEMSSFDPSMSFNSWTKIDLSAENRKFPSYFRAEESDRMRGRIMASDIRGTPILEFSFSFARDLRAQGRETMQTVVYAFLIALVVTLVAQSWSLQKKVLNKILHLREQVLDVAHQNFSQRVDVSGHDEISELAQKINTMLIALEERQREEVRQTERIHTLQLEQVLLNEREASEKALRLESELRFQLAGMLAHRINNPLNYILLGLGSLEDSVKELEKALGILLGAGAEPGSELAEVQRQFDVLLNKLVRPVSEVKSGLSLALEPVQELRALSGVDGIPVHDFLAVDLLRGAQKRLSEIWPTQRKLSLEPSTAWDKAALLKGNLAVYKSALELVFVVMRDQSQGDLRIEFEPDSKASWKLHVRGDFRWERSVCIALERCLKNLLATACIECTLQMDDHALEAVFSVKIPSLAGALAPLEKDAQTSKAS